MREFILEPDMLTGMGGVFYPKGWAIVMFPTADHAQEIGQALVVEAGLGHGEVMKLSPETVLRDIANTEEGNDDPLPSVGTEGQTVRMFGELARKGHHGIAFRTDSDEVAERAMEIVKRAPYSFGQRYRMLVIEDL